MKLSIVLSTSGNDAERHRNLMENLQCIHDQTFTDYELVMVEQSLDGKIYNSNLGIKNFYVIEDKQNRGFNLSWCRNCGAKKATGELIVLMDADFIFGKDYFQNIVNTATVFAGGATKYLWSRPNQVIEWYNSGKNLQVFDKHYIGWTSLDAAKGIGYGGILIFNREWYWNVLGGSSEDFFKYGWEDRSLCFRTLQLLNIQEKDVKRIPNYCIHLSHGNKIMSNDNINQKLYEREKLIPAKQIAERLKQAGVGDTSSPRPIGI